MNSGIDTKQALVLRTDLKMGKGKMIAQASHASIMSYLACLAEDQRISENWIASGEKKIVLKVTGESDLVALFRDAKRAGIPCALVADAGLTQLEPGTKTALGIGPWIAKEIDEITEKLKLL